ncbi:hypothetical protein [Lentzea sp. NPDC060358]|uniref:hypothetical protein n=1 Tax=Lentzea sp. NPDC060358 TaxID=3347103 RepID=UPI003648B934
MVKKAKAFLAKLNESQRSRVLQDYSLANAARWHTYPDFALGDLRLGLRVWIELRMDDPCSTVETAPHTLWRGKVSDYGGTRE